MGNLIARIRRMVFALILGVCLITYIALGFLYWQQGLKQQELTELIDKTSAVVSKPVPSVDKLQAEYEAVKQSLSPVTVPEALAIIVSIARDSGIDVDPASGMFHIPAPSSPATKKIGESNYQVLSISNIRVQGDPDSVMAFLSDLDSGKTRATMLLNGVQFSQIEINYQDEEAARRAEFRKVLSAVAAMMVDNGVTEIPNPISYADGTATNYMGDDPGTEGVKEGFPDITITATQKGYTGTEAPKDGYLLYRHDKIATDNTTQFETVDYIAGLTTQYYYTCEADGTVRQFDGPDLSTATEYLGSEEFRTESVVTLGVKFYAKP